MTSETPDVLYPIAIEEKELEIPIIASIQTLKRGNKKCGNEVFKTRLMVSSRKKF